jgi:hypothetical protein
MKQFFLLFALTFFFSCNLINDKERNRKSKTLTAKNIKRPFYEMQYPSDWNIDTADKDFDIDSYFSIHAPVQDGLSIFIIFNIAIDEEESLANQVKAHLNKTMKNGLTSYFDHWGKFKGHGATIKGKMMGVWKGEIEIFCHSGDSCSFLTVAQYLDNEREIVLPGLQLIESSFKLKK